MGFNINKITSRIAKSNFVTKLPTKVNNVASSLGGKVDSLCNKSDKFSKALNSIEPTGGDNSWFMMLGLMISMVIGPRTIAAAQRNPDNKEATKDEIAEILFRDIQTVAIMLFALKALNTLISAAAGKISGIPMSNKPFEQVFNTKGIKNKAQEFIQTPVEKAKILAKNVWDVINPLGGKNCYTKEQACEKYSGYETIDQIKKMFDTTKKQKGDPDKIFKIVTDSLINDQKTQIALFEKQQRACGIPDNRIEAAKNALQNLVDLQNGGYENFRNGTTKIDELTKYKLISFFNDKNNPLAKKVSSLIAWLKSIALGIEIGYLGFGLPFLNQKRLERKYLKTQPKEQLPDTIHEVKNIAIKNVKLKEQEVKLFHNFIK